MTQDFQSEERKKGRGNIEPGLSDLSDNIKLLNLLVIRVPEGKAENH